MLIGLDEFAGSCRIDQVGREVGGIIYVQQGTKRSTTMTNNHFQIELLSHNGVVGHQGREVSPFDGAIIDLLPTMTDGLTPVGFTIHHEGRAFTYAYTVDFPTNGFYCFREKVQGKPSLWAQRRAAELAARVPA
jgi:hypothetical protein